MEALILGAGPGLPNLKENLSSVVVRAHGMNILLDCGEGCSRSLLARDLAYDALDAVLISHYHPDHISGIFMLAQMLYLQKRVKPLPVFLPENPDFIREMLHYQYTFPARFGFEMLLLNMEELPLRYPFIQAQLTDHLDGYRNYLVDNQLNNPMRSFAFRIKDDAGDLVYTADIQTTDCISGLLDGCHTAIVDAMHPEMEQIIKLRDMNIKRVILTHGRSAELAAWLESNPDHGFTMAEENTVYKMGI